MVSGSSDLANFPVFVTLTNDPDLTSAKVGVNGQGIRFTSDGTTAVPFEIESYDQGTRTLVAWVKLTVDHDDDTRFYIHYDQTEAISPDPAANVWTNYVAVNHLHSDPDTTTSNKEIVGSKGTGEDTWNTMGQMNSDDQVTGKINGALDFDGDNDRVCLDDVDTQSNNNWNCSNSDTSSLFDDRQQNRTVELWYLSLIHI